MLASQRAADDGPTRAKPSGKGAGAGYVIIDLTNDPSWRHTVQAGLIEHANRYFNGGHALGLQVTTKLLLEPALDFCAKFTGDEIVMATDGAFDVDKYKEGSITMTKAFSEERVIPLCAHFAATSSGDLKQRFGKRQVVLSCLFIYANHLIKNSQRDERFIK
jgi:hypothetical protein